MTAESRNDLIYDWNVHEGPLAPARGQVEINDETLRDGLQSPSVHDPPIEEKIEILHLMAEIGIDAANLGLPGAGPRAVADVTRLAQEIARAGLAIRANCAARTVLADIQPIADIQQKTGVRIEAATFIGSSQIRKVTEDWDMDRMLRSTEEAVTWAARHDLDPMYVTEDTTRAHPETIRRLYQTAIRCGAKRLVFCDTVGHATPEGARALVRFARDLVREAGVPDMAVDWHGHNDRGFGLINAIAAGQAGADRLHGCALGIGERTGNTSMDHLIVNLHLLGWRSRGNLARIPAYVQAVSRSVKVPIPSNYPVVGRDAFETGTGVHASAVIKALKKGDPWLANRVYSGVPADEFGLGQRIVIGPMSGKSNVIFWLESRGLPATDDVVQRIFDAAKRSPRILAEDEVRSLVEAKRPVDEWSAG